LTRVSCWKISGMVSIGYRKPESMIAGRHVFRAFYGVLFGVRPAA
jgi:hypothetical protein